MNRQLSEILADILDEKKSQNLLLASVVRGFGGKVDQDPGYSEEEGLAGILENILIEEKKATELIDWLSIRFQTSPYGAKNP
jgi:hypothetical protein